jgi:hypothetical protein
MYRYCDRGLGHSSEYTSMLTTLRVDNLMKETVIRQVIRSITNIKRSSGCYNLGKGILPDLAVGR